MAPSSIEHKTQPPSREAAQNLSRQARLDELPAWHSVAAPKPTAVVAIVEVGARMQRALLRGLPVDHLLLDRARRVAWMTDGTANPDLQSALAMVVSNLRGISDWRDQTFSTMSRGLARMALHLEYQGVRRVDEIDAHALETWIRSATKRQGTFRDPSVSTQHFRLSVARFFFRSLQFLQVPLIDPTNSVDLPPRSAVSTRPLTDEEEMLCRLVTQHTLTETRRPVAWALGQATATTAEQATLLVKDVDLDASRVWLAGNGRRAARWGYLTPWGQTVVAHAIRRDDPPDRGLIYSAQTNPESGTASVCKAVSDVLCDAGFGPDKTVRPQSLIGWAGRKILDETGRIQVVAARLGLTKLDSAAAVIDWDWSSIDWDESS